MNKKLLNPGVQNFIIENLNTDILSVLLKKSPFSGISARELAQQIEGRKKCQERLPLWYATPGIYFPKKENLEQASSEITAIYKSRLVGGVSMIDLTGGFGVDSFYFSRSVGNVTYCEEDVELAAIASYNYKILGACNINVRATDGISFLKGMSIETDWAYLDPSRRVAGSRVFKFADCRPVVPENLDLLFSKAGRILIKAAPLLDISMGIKQLQGVQEVHVVAVKNEVKELVWVLRRDYQGEVTIKTVQFGNSVTRTFDFRPEEERQAVPEIGHPLEYLYEPNPALLKAGAFKLIATRLTLRKLHEHTHLYTSGKRKEFPGRIFRILDSVPYKKGSMGRFTNTKANITIRNFPESVRLIREKFKIKEGGKVYLFFIRDVSEQLTVLHCEKL